MMMPDGGEVFVCQGIKGFGIGAMASCPGEFKVLKREHLHKLGRPYLSHVQPQGKTILNLLDKIDKAQDSLDCMYASLDLRRHLSATCAYEPDNDAEPPTVRAVLCCRNGPADMVPGPRCLACAQVLRLGSFKSRLARKMQAQRKAQAAAYLD